MGLGSNNRKWIVWALVGLLLYRALTLLVLYKGGFTALTADDFGRAVKAAMWSKDPAPQWSGYWLPFHAYLYGTALYLQWELLWVPRAIAIAFGFISIVLMYRLATGLFRSRVVGLTSAFLLTVNPAHIWLSAAPLAELPAAVLWLAALWTYALYQQQHQRSYLVATACALALANGVRYESWLLSSLFTLTLAREVFFGATTSTVRGTRPFDALLAGILPWFFPLVWLVGNYIERGHPLYFAVFTRLDQLKWFGSTTSYANYVVAFLAIDPFLTILGVVALVVGIWRYRQSRAVLWYAAATSVPLIMYIVLSGGQVQPAANYTRYFAPYVFLFYPWFGSWLVASSRAIPGKLLRAVLNAVVLCTVAATQMRTTFGLANDPAGAGLAVGLAIRELRERMPEISDRPVLIELSYWQYLAIHVGANDLTRIMYDRGFDFDSRSSQSLLLSDVALFRACLKVHNVSYVVVKDARLRGVIQDELQLQLEKEVNGYAFYRASASVVDSMPLEARDRCPLPFGWGF